MNQLQIFKNELFEVGAKVENETILFDAEQVAKCLGITDKKNGTEYVRWNRVNSYLPKNSPLVAKGSLIPEPLVYKLAFKASNEVAEQFQDWLAIEVIPSIRKNGGYISTTEDDDEQSIMAKALLIANKTIERKQKEIERSKRVIEQQRPKVLFAELIETSKSSILVRELAKLLKQNGVDFGEKRLFAWLRENGYLIKRSGTDYNMPTQRSMDLGLFEIKETPIPRSSGITTINKTPKVTGKGQLYFLIKLTNKERAV